MSVVVIVPHRCSVLTFPLFYIELGLSTIYKHYYNSYSIS